MIRFSKLLALLAAVVCLWTCFVLAEEPTATALPEEGTLVPEGEVLLSPEREVPSYVESLLEVAREELGYTEDRYKNTKYGVWAGDPDAEWCAEYLCWCVDQTDKRYGTALLNNSYPLYSASNTGRNWFIRQGRYVARSGFVPDWGSQWFSATGERVEKNAYIPQPGDWMFFSISATGDTSHVAMVEFCTVDANGKVRVHVLEGNNPEKVARNSYPIDNWAIQGYGTVHEWAGITMRAGNEGLRVSDLQRKLVLLGYLGGQYITGKYGSLTAQAVKDFQKSAGITVTGIAGQETQQALEERMNEYYRQNPDLWSVDPED